MHKNWQKLIKSLHQKKYRQEEQLFLVEGAKSVAELLQYTQQFEVKAVFYTPEFYESYQTLLAAQDQTKVILQQTTATLLEASGTLQSNDGALAIVKIPNNLVANFANGYVLALSDIRDPGNLGTIIRIADWYGISQLLCSATTVDWYNPKVIIASMGSFLRVKPYYCDLVTYLQEIRQQTNLPIYGTTLEGENLHQTQFESQGIVVIGNESNGIAVDILPLLTHQITIPRFGKAESLNAGIATGIVCDNLARALKNI